MRCGIVLDVMHLFGRLLSDSKEFCNYFFRLVFRIGVPFFFLIPSLVLRWLFLLGCFFCCMLLVYFFFHVFSLKASFFRRKKKFSNSILLGFRAMYISLVQALKTPFSVKS